MKKLFLLGLLLAGFVSMQAQGTSSTNLRKGLHLGAHFTPGFGTIYTEAYDNLAIDFGMTAGLDVNIYFTELLGMHTGLSYYKLPWRYKFFDNVGDPNNYKDVSATVESVGIPIKFLLTTGKNVVGFYLEAGFSLYFPTSYRSDLNLGILSTSTLMFAPEVTAGMNIRASELISFNVSGFSTSSFVVFSNLNSASVGILYGIKLGVMFRLTK